MENIKWRLRFKAVVLLPIGYIWAGNIIISNRKMPILVYFMREMLIFYLRLQNFEDFSVDRLIYNLSGALPSELDWQQEQWSRKQSPSAITCRHQKELVNNYYQATIIISCNNYYRLQQCGKSRNIYALCYVLKYKHWLCCLFLDVLWISSQKLRVKLEMTSAVWGREKEAWRAAESWRVKSYGQASHSHLSKPVQHAEMGISE